MDVPYWEGQASWAWPSFISSLVNFRLSLSMWVVG